MFIFLTQMNKSVSELSALLSDIWVQTASPVKTKLIQPCYAQEWLERPPWSSRINHISNKNHPAQVSHWLHSILQLRLKILPFPFFVPHQVFVNKYCRYKSMLEVTVRIHYYDGFGLSLLCPLSHFLLQELPLTDPELSTCTSYLEYRVCLGF